ncbi:MAG: hypothetical protein GX638_12320 [Crenarchaeota archaeon]|nr:hypothetical protein [Thermoproteota archaeon]
MGVPVCDNCGSLVTKRYKCKSCGQPFCYECKLRKGFDNFVHIFFRSEKKATKGLGNELGITQIIDLVAANRCPHCGKDNAWGGSTLKRFIIVMSIVTIGVYAMVGDKIQFSETADVVIPILMVTASIIFLSLILRRRSKAKKVILDEMLEDDEKMLMCAIVAPTNKFENGYLILTQNRLIYSRIFLLKSEKEISQMPLSIIKAFTKKGREIIFRFQDDSNKGDIGFNLSKSDSWKEAIDKLGVVYKDKETFNKEKKEFMS